MRARGESPSQADSELSAESDAGLDPANFRSGPELKPRVGGPDYTTTQAPLLSHAFRVVVGEAHE